MTRKHYVAIAAIIAEAHTRYTDHAPILYIQKELLELLAAENPNFDARRFLDACIPKIDSE